MLEFKLKIIFLIFGIIIIIPIMMLNSSAQMEESSLFDKANEYFSKGQFNEAILTYDKILEKYPNNDTILKMKGISASNLGNHEESLREFFKVLKDKPDDVTALIGMGVGFGNLGEYKEATSYLKKANQLKPDNPVIKNYLDRIEKITSKYPYTPTEKPSEKNITIIPNWLKKVANWWFNEFITDSEFINAVKFLIDTNQIQLPGLNDGKKIVEFPIQIKKDANLWANETTQDEEFARDIEFMIENKIINGTITKLANEKQSQQDYYSFEKYLQRISNNIKKEKRYIEDLNPSNEIIKKFHSGHMRWNFGDYLTNSTAKFPDPSFELIDGVYVIDYKVFINTQPSELPLDYRGSLNSSFEYWEGQEIVINDKKAKVKFVEVKEKSDANIWVTWVIKDLDGALGHAHLGKGIVEVTIGDYNCDGRFQLYDVNSVEKIMTHELGHSIGLSHSSDKGNIMQPGLSPNYAYCLVF